MKKATVSKDMMLKDLKNRPELVAIQKQVREDTIRQLLEWRKEKKMTQNDICLITGIQRPNISRMESGNYNPTLDMVVRIADSMGLKVTVTISEKE